MKIFIYINLEEVYWVSKYQQQQQQKQEKKRIKGQKIK